VRCSLTAAIRAWVNYCNWSLVRGASTRVSNVATSVRRALHHPLSLLSPSHCTASASEKMPGCQWADWRWMRERDVRSILISFDFITFITSPYYIHTKNTIHTCPLSPIKSSLCFRAHPVSSALPTVSVPRASACLHFPESIHDQIHYFFRKLHV